MGYWLGIVFSCLDVLCVAVFCDAFLERKTRGLRFVVGGAALRSLVLYRYGFRFAYFGRIADNTFKICRTYYGLLRFCILALYREILVAAAGGCFGVCNFHLAGILRSLFSAGMASYSL